MTDGKLSRYLHKKTSKRKAIGNLGAIGVVVILVVGLFAFAYFYIGPPTSGSTLGTKTSSSIAAGNVPGKIQFTVLNPTSGAALTPTTFTIYPGAGVTVGGVTYTGQTPSESPAVTSGVATTSQFYPPGAALTIKMALSGSISENWNIVSPGVTVGQQSQGTAAAITLPMMQAPTIVVSLTDGAGNTYASAGNKINFTKSGTCTSGDNCLGTSSTKLTVTITNTAPNTGYLSTFDPLNNVPWCMGAAISEGTSGTPNAATYSGMPTTFSVGSVRYLETTLPDGYVIGSGVQPNTFNNAACGGSYTIASGGITEQVIGASTYGGSISFGFTAGQGSLAHGNSIVDTLKIWEYASPAYAVANSGVQSPSAVQLGSSFTFTLAA